VQIDVEVPGKAYISVGGPAKAEDLAELGRHLQKLKAAADEKRVRAIMYLEEGTPEVVINLAKKWLGKENVIKFQVNYRDYYGVVP
jgi:filamentous hemagglutinin